QRNKLIRWDNSRLWMFPADKYLTARQYPSLRAENRLDPRFEFVVFQRQTDGFRRDDIVTTVIRDIKIIFISRATDDLRMILKKDIQTVIVYPTRQTIVVS